MLNVGDRIRIVGIPGEGDPNYYIHPETRQVFLSLIARGRSVRISELRHDMAWFNCRFSRQGRWVNHRIGLSPADTNWVAVKSQSVADR